MSERKHDLNPVPGLKSLFTWGFGALGAINLFLGQTSNDHDNAIYFLAIAGTFLLTKNQAAQLASIAGAGLRMEGGQLTQIAGFALQGIAFFYAAKDSTKNLNELIKLERNNNENINGPVNR